MLTTLFFSLSLSTLALALPTSDTLTSRQASTIPQYVLDHAPLCYLDTNAMFFPSSLTTHLANIHPTVNSTTITNSPNPLTISNLNTLNNFGNGGINVYLTANGAGVASDPYPSWFKGVKPDPSTHAAPGCTIILAPKANGVLDAFYFFFYSYDLGSQIYNLGSTLEFGDHLGDWEHVNIRFVNGVPSQMYFSQHSGGTAIQYPYITKDPATNRPINYVAKGTHANYATPGNHDHTIPGFTVPIGFGPLVDSTSKGALWDPLKGAMAYTYDTGSASFTSISGDPTGWLDFKGHWGDIQLPDSDSRQHDIFGARKYVSGPTGPKDKNLGRADVCESDPCVVLPFLV